MAKYTLSLLYVLIFVSCLVMTNTGHNKSTFKKRNHTKFLKIGSKQNARNHVSKHIHVLNSYNFSRKLRNSIQQDKDKQFSQQIGPSIYSTVHNKPKLHLGNNEDKLLYNCLSR